MYKRIAILLLATFLLAGCGTGNDKMEKIKDLEFTVLSEDDFPEELKTIIEEKKDQAFKMTYQDNGFLYICIGYGADIIGLSKKNLEIGDSA